MVRLRTFNPFNAGSIPVASISKPSYPNGRGERLKIATVQVRILPRASRRGGIGSRTGLKSQRP